MSAVCPRKIQKKNNGWGGGMNMMKASNWKYGVYGSSFCCSGNSSVRLKLFYDTLSFKISPKMLER